MWPRIYAEGIALDVNGYLSEGSGENLFVVKNGGRLETMAGSVSTALARVGAGVKWGEVSAAGGEPGPGGDGGSGGEDSSDGELFGEPGV